MVDLTRITNAELSALIDRRQRQLLVHSIIYYKLNDSVISDTQWAEWAVELEELQRKFPSMALAQPYGKAFVGFDHSTGYNLPLDDPDAVQVARKLLENMRKDRLK